MSRRGLTLIEVVVAIGILISAMLVAFSVFLQSNATAALSSELALAEHGAERMLDLIRADGGGVIDFSDHYTVYGGSARLPFGFDTAAPTDSVLHPAPFGWADPISGRPRLRDPIGWLFVAVDADERVSPPVPTQVMAETLFAGNGPFGAAVAGVDVNGDLDADDDNAGLLGGVGSSYTGALLPVTIVVEWVSGDGGFPTRRTFKLRTLVPRED